MKIEKLTREYIEENLDVVQLHKSLVLHPLGHGGFLCVHFEDSRFWFSYLPDGTHRTDPSGDNIIAELPVYNLADTEDAYLEDWGVYDHEKELFFPFDGSEGMEKEEAIAESIEGGAWYDYLDEVIDSIMEQLA